MSDPHTDVLDVLIGTPPPLAPDYAGTVLRHARRRRMQRRVAGATSLAAVAAIALSGSLLLRGADRPMQLVQTPSASPTSSAVVTTDEVAIQAAAVRALADRVGNGRPWPVLFVLAHRYDDIVNPRSQPRVAQAIPPSEQAAMTRALADYAPVRFVAQQEDAHRVGGLGEVRDGGALVTLGAIVRRGADAAELTLSVQAGGKNGQGLTYTVARAGGTWAVTGTTGTQWIS